MQTALLSLSQKKSVNYTGRLIVFGLFTLALSVVPNVLKQYYKGTVKPSNSYNKKLASFMNGLSPTLKSAGNKHAALRAAPKAVDTANLKQSDWFNTVKKDLEKRMYNVAAGSDGKTYSSTNIAQQLKAEYSPAGFTVQSVPEFDVSKNKPSGHPKITNNWQLNMQVKGLYADDQLIEQPICTTTTASNNDIEYNFGNQYAIQYHNDAKGVRQDFIIKQKPAINTRELKVRLQVAGDWVVDKVHDKELHFAKQNNKGGLDNKITYNDLKVWDANGKPLAAKMVVDKDNSFEIVADAGNAVYPVTIDPLSSTPSTTITGSATFGFSVASAGDINGDGYSDVVVGDEAGNVSLFLGAASGLSSTALTTITGGADATFGATVASAGDVNGDGFADIVVGDAAGNAYIFNGSSSGITVTLASAASATITGGTDLTFGLTVAGAGDVNGDGFSDVIVGDGEGFAYIFAGSAGGISSGVATTIATTTLSGVGGVHFGASVASAGDVNADGYSDVIIGDAGGDAYIFDGSATGIANLAAPTVSLSGAGFFGASVASAGDVNGDGYSDVIVGEPTLAGTGQAFVYVSNFASITGATVATTLTIAADANYGITVASAGDVNGDAFGDIIVGDNNGNAFVYLGSTSGISTTAANTLTGAGLGNSVASAGDVNGDGYSDVVVGATSKGTAYTYQGSPTGSASTNTINFQEPTPTAGDQFGFSVSSAGDVNGDGFSDVLVGANGYQGGSTGTNLGAFYLYLGGPSGLSTSPSGTPISGPSFDDNFGISVASGGDINGDGYGDVIIGGMGYNSLEGIVYIYYGSSAGINPTPAILNDPGATSNDQFGYSVSSAGDVNGDGYADVVIGAPGAAPNDQGTAYLFMGSATGVSTTPITLANNGSDFANFGTSVANAGDVNGDGYSDVIIGTFGSGGNSAFIFLGSKTGIANNAVANISLAGSFGNQTSGDFGYSVSSAGDVNGDGFSDVIVGAPFANSTGTAALFLGSSSGTNTTAATVFQGLNSGDQFGIAVGSAGDVNGDGYSDIVIKSARGPVYVYQGSPAGFAGSVTTASANTTYTDGVDATGDGEFQNHLSIASAGDVNGDGYSDIIQGVYETNSLAGTAYVYYGNSAVGHNASNVIRLFETDLVTPIKQDNVALRQFGLGLYAQSPFGHVKGRLVWEVVGNGSPFSGNPITNSVNTSGQQSTYAPIAPGGSLYTNLVNKTTSLVTKVRARIQYTSTAVTFGQVYSPWIYSQVYLTTGTSTVLPLNLLSFTATPVNNQNIVLNWKTAEEQDTKSFIIEHSLDDINFAALDSVNAAGNSTTTTSYQYTHYHPSAGVHYYRLKEEDLNGHFTYSPIASATIYANVQFTISPNPTSDVLTITYIGISQSSMVRIVDGAGNVVRQYSIDPNSSQMTVSLNGIAKGMYFVQLVNSGFAPKQLSVQ